jgi:hypothetical protein
VSEPFEFTDAERRDFGRRLSHVTSEVGLLRRDVEAMRQECKSDLVGTLEVPGVLVRLDRIEQRHNLAKWLLGGGAVSTLAALAAAAKALGVL